MLASAKPRPIAFDIPQYLGLELVNINAYAFFFVSKYSTPFKRNRLVSFFLNLDLGKKVNRKVQEEPQAEAAANTRRKRKSETD